jgi:hypothetical protein
VAEHELKIVPRYFEDVRDGRKLFEVRLDDRGYQVGDVLRLREWDPILEAYTGRVDVRGVTYVLTDSQGLQRSYVVLGLDLPASRLTEAKAMGAYEDGRAHAPAIAEIVEAKVRLEARGAELEAALCDLIYQPHDDREWAKARAALAGSQQEAMPPLEITAGPAEPEQD